MTSMDINIIIILKTTHRSARRYVARLPRLLLLVSTEKPEVEESVKKVEE